MQASLGADALTTTDDGVALRLGLPWIRSLPVSGLLNLAVALDGEYVPEARLRIVLGERRIAPSELKSERAWWFVQDRIVVEASRRLAQGRHEVAAHFQLLVPYLPGGPGQPLVLPFRLAASLELDARPVARVSRDVGA